MNESDGAGETGAVDALDETGAAGASDVTGAFVAFDASGVTVTREDLVVAAKELNKVLNLDPPGIDPESSQENIRNLLIEAVRGDSDHGPLIRADDKISDETRAVLFALTEDPLVAPKAAKTPKVKAAKTPKTPKVKAVKTPKTPKVAKVKAAPKPKPPKAAKPEGDRREKSSRHVGKPSKPAGEFRQIGANTMRGKIFSRMDGTRTVAEIAAEIGITASNAGGYIHGLWRDNGVGFSYDASKHILSALPEGVENAFRD